MNAAKEIILLLWLLIVASLGNVSASTPGATENRTWEKSLAAVETRQAELLQTLGGHQENEEAGYDYVVYCLVAAEATVVKTIGLGLDGDLMNLRGTGAITYKNAGWQQAGLTTVDVGRATEASWFRMSFNEASQNAGAIRFDVSSFDLAYPKPGMTSWELNQVVNDPSLLGKTTFIKNGEQVLWDGSGFLKPCKR